MVVSLGDVVQGKLIDGRRRFLAGAGCKDGDLHFGRLASLTRSGVISRELLVGLDSFPVPLLDSFNTFLCVSTDQEQVRVLLQ